MNLDLLLGSCMMVVCMTIQCVVVALLLRGLHALESRHLIRSAIVPASALLIAVLLILFASNLLQIALWSGLFLAFGEFDDLNTAFYHSMVNFSTLGYGDLVMSSERRLLGALEAANGVMMLGLSTSVLYWLVGALSRRGWQRMDEESASAAIKR
jgi:hypothetical protein